MASDQMYLTTGEAAQRLRGRGVNVSEAQVRRWARKGRLETITLPNGRRQIKAADIDAIAPAPA